MTPVHARAAVTPLAGTFGVRIDGVDVANDSSEQLVDALRSILDQYLVIHLPGQGDLAPEQLLAFAALWGEVARHPNVPSLPGCDGVLEVAHPTEQVAAWHHDVSYVDRPPAVTMHVAREVPGSGGDTLWADQYTAHARLSRGLRDALVGLFAVHEATFAAADGDRWPVLESSVHPVVVRHDRTRRRALFVDPNYTTRLDGWEPDESRALLDHLLRASVRPELTCRHRWAVGDLVIWDNRATVHRTVDDLTPGATRVLHRVTIAGDVPR